MKVLIFGVRGFIGSAVRRNLQAQYEVYGTTRSAELEANEFRVDLLDADTIKTVLQEVQPEIIINCAGVIDAKDDVTLNEKYTRAILQSVVDVELKVRQIIIAGSAAEYGIVSVEELPVSEDVPLRAVAEYGKAKVAEEQTALEFSKQYGLPVIVLRIFNLIGKGMGKKFLVSSLRAQFSEYQAGTRDAIEINRKDSKRDYIAIDDLADAMKALIENQPKHAVYNVGSGRSTTNEELLQFFIDSVAIAQAPQITETSSEPEPIVAVQADITRLKDDTGWQPARPIADTIREIMNDDTSH